MSIEILVVAHTSWQALESTLRSVAAQTVRAAVVVVDMGGPGDRSGTRPPLVDELIGQGLCQFIALPGLNRYAVLNRGIAQCRGDYLMVLHEGDMLADPHVLADSQREIEAQQGPEVLYGERIKYIGARWYHKRPRRHDQVALGMFVELSCMLIRRDLFQAVSFDVSYQEAGDYAFVCQLMQAVPEARWHLMPRTMVYVVLDKLHEGHLLTKLREDWRVQRHLVRAGLPTRLTVLSTRLVSQLLRKACRLTLGYPGFRSGVVPTNEDGRVVP